jgi:hypothetical protein
MFLLKYLLKAKIKLVPKLSIFNIYTNQNTLPMKRTYFLLILLMLTVCFTHKAQSQELDYAKSRDYWVVDENQNPVVSKVFALPSMRPNQIFTKSL